MLGTATVVEVVWTAVGMVGMILHAVMAMIAAGDLQHWLADGGDDRGRIAGGGNIRREILSAAVQLCFVQVGVAAMLTPPNPNVSAYSGAGLGIIVAELLLITNSLADHRTRHALLAYVEHLSVNGGITHMEPTTDGVMTLVVAAPTFGEIIARKLSSRKFWVWVAAVAGAVGLFLSGQLSAEALVTALIAASASYQVGEGIADSGQRALPAVPVASTQRVVQTP